MFTNNQQDDYCMTLALIILLQRKIIIINQRDFIQRPPDKEYIIFFLEKYKNKGKGEWLSAMKATRSEGAAGSEGSAARYKFFNKALDLPQGCCCRGRLAVRCS